MTQTDKLCVYYFFAIYIWYDAVVINELASVYFSSGLYQDIQGSIAFFGLAVARPGLTAIAIFVYFKGLRFDIYMWVMNLILLASFAGDIKVHYIDEKSILSENSALGFTDIMNSIFFFSACACCIYLIVRIRVFNQLPISEKKDRPF